MATVPVVGIRAIVSALERLGLDPGALLADAGLARSDLTDPDGRLPTDQADALWAAAYRRSGDERLAMRAAQQLRAGDYRTLTYLAAACPTLGAGLTRILGFFDLVDRRIRWTLDDASDPVSLRLGFDGVADPLPRPAVEYTLGATVVSTRLTTGLDWRPLRVEVGFPRPDDDAAAEHEDVLGPMVYEAEHTRLLIAGTWWRHPVPNANRGVAELLTDLAGRQVRDLPPAESLEERLHGAIGNSLVGGPPTVDEVAKTLGMSTRSLQRRLAEAGTSFRHAVDEVRKRNGVLLVEDRGLALSEVSWLLGFSDPRAFTRAFRRWHDTTPSAWRA
ncbi:MAG: AraC family transcriptional regulator [Myxococcota bacterium]